MQKQTKNRRNKKHHQNAFETLESRQLYSVVMVNPGNAQSAINSSKPGDTLTFAPGNYSPFTALSDRTYVGNGASINGQGTGQGSDVLNLSNTTNVDFSGFVLNGTQAYTPNANGLNFHNNTVTNLPSTYGLYDSGMTNSHINNNTFTQIGWCGIYGNPGNGNTFNYNAFDYVHEAIHMVGSQDSTQVNGNVITHATRIGIELQDGMTNLQVENNYMSDWLQQGTGTDDSHMGISCATGGQGANDVGAGEHITISGNVILQSGPAQALNHNAKAAIEIMGDLDIKITNNFLWGWGCYLLNGSTGTGVNSSNNIVEATTPSDGLYATDSISLPIGRISGTGDTLYAMNASNAPAIPTKTTNAGANSTGTTSTMVSSTPAPTTSSVAAPTNLAAVSPSSTEVDLSWTDNSKGAGTYVLQRRATHGTAGFETIATLAAGTTSYKDTSVNPSWEYDYQLTAVVSGASSAVATVHTQVQAAPAPIVTTPVVTTPVVSTPVVSTPVVTTPVASTPATTATTAAPTNVAVTAAGPGQITVTWTAGQGVPTIYIYPTNGVGGAAAAIDLGQLAAGSTSATIGGINNSWEVIAEVSFTANGVESAKTAASDIQVVNSTIAPSAAFAPALATTAAATQTTTTTTTTTTSTAPAATSALAAATNLTATSPNSGEVDLSWTDNTNGAATYVLERRATNGTTGFQPIATIAAGVTTYSDVHVNANWEYDYVLTAVQSGVGSTAVSAHVQVQNSATTTIAAAVTVAPVIAVAPSTDTATATTAGAATVAPTVAPVIAVAPSTDTATTTTAATATATAAATPTAVPTESSNTTIVDVTSVDDSDAPATYVLPAQATKGSAGLQLVGTRPARATASTETSRISIVAA